MDIDRLLRTYMHLNDPKYEGITYKFAGGFLVLAVAMGLSYWAGAAYDMGPDAPLATEGAPDDGADDDGDATGATSTTTVYVGVNPEQFDPATFDPEQPQAMLDQWLTDHPDVVVEHWEVVKAPGNPDLVIGYQLTYR